MQSINLTNVEKVRSKISKRLFQYKINAISYFSYNQIDLERC